MSPQQYFQEQKGGKEILDLKELSIHLPWDGGVMCFPFHHNNNLLFMLLDIHPSLLSVSRKDVTLITNPNTILMSVADQTNQNLAASQKELLVWYWKLIHAYMPWVWSLFQEPHNGGLPILKSSHKLTGELVAKMLKYAVCEFSKASKQQLNHTFQAPRGKSCLRQHQKIRKEDLEPG